MKELLRANDIQKNHIDALWRTLITARGAEQIVKSNPNSAATIQIEDLELIISAEEFAKILNGGAGGLYNELAHPLIENGQKKARYFKATNKKMRAAALKIIQEAKNARFELKENKFSLPEEE